MCRHTHVNTRAPLCAHTPTATHAHARPHPREVHSNRTGCRQGTGSERAVRGLQWAARVRGLQWAACVRGLRWAARVHGCGSPRPACLHQACVAAPRTCAHHYACCRPACLRQASVAALRAHALPTGGRGQLFQQKHVHGWHVFWCTPCVALTCTHTHPLLATAALLPHARPTCPTPRLSAPQPSRCMRTHELRPSCVRASPPLPLRCTHAPPPTSLTYVCPRWRARSRNVAAQAAARGP